jgi:hypothetical protein
MLGKRTGLSKPMPKAEALQEAKKWLRGLATEEVAKAESESPQVSRGEPRPWKGTAVATHPFEHPHFWAAFVLVSDLDRRLRIGNHSAECKGGQIRKAGSQEKFGLSGPPGFLAT